MFDKYSKLKLFLHNLNYDGLYNHLFCKKDLNEDVVIHNINYLRNYNFSYDQIRRIFGVFSKFRKSNVFMLVEFEQLEAFHASLVESIPKDKVKKTGSSFYSVLLSVANDNDVPELFRSIYSISKIEEDLLKEDSKSVAEILERHVNVWSHNLSDTGLNCIGHEESVSLHDLRSMQRQTDREIIKDCLKICPMQDKVFLYNDMYCDLTNSRGRAIDLEVNNYFRMNPDVLYNIFRQTNFFKNGEYFDLKDFYSDSNYYNRKLGFLVFEAVDEYLTKHVDLLTEMKTNYRRSGYIQRKFDTGFTILKNRLDCIDDGLFEYLFKDHQEKLIDILKTLETPTVMDSFDEEAKQTNLMSRINELTSKIFLFYKISRYEDDAIMASSTTYYFIDAFMYGRENGFTEEDFVNLRKAYIEEDKRLLSSFHNRIITRNTKSYDYLELFEYFDSFVKPRVKKEGVQKASRLYEIDTNLISLLDFDIDCIQSANSKKRINSALIETKSNTSTPFISYLSNLNSATRLLEYITTHNKYDIYPILFNTRKRVVTHNMYSTDKLITDDSEAIDDLIDLYYNGEKDLIHAFIHLAYIENNIAHTSWVSRNEKTCSMKTGYKNLHYFEDYSLQDLQDFDKKLKAYINHILGHMEDRKLHLSSDEIEFIRQIFKIYKGNWVDSVELLKFLLEKNIPNPQQICENIIKDYNPAYDKAIEHLLTQQVSYSLKEKYGSLIIKDFFEKIGTDKMFISKEDAKNFYEKYGYLINIKYDPIYEQPVLFILDKHFEFTHSIHLVREQFPIVVNGVTLEYDDFVNNTYTFDYTIYNTNNLRKPLKVINSRKSLLYEVNILVKFEKLIKDNYEGFAYIDPKDIVISNDDSEEVATRKRELLASYGLTELDLASALRSLTEKEITGKYLSK